VAIVKEGLTSRDLVKHAKNLNYLKTQISEHAEMYSNLQEQFNTEAFEGLYNGTTTYTLQTLEELTALREALTEQLNQSSVNPTVIEVIVKEAISTYDLDQIIEQIYGVAKADSTNTLMILSGKQGAQHEERILSFVQADSRILAQTGAATNNTDVRINKFLTPNVLTGLMVAIFIFSILLMGFLMLFDVQTPTVFATASIDFGKIEK
jgi:hypothetical protein